MLQDLAGGNVGAGAGVVKLNNAALGCDPCGYRTYSESGGECPERGREGGATTVVGSYRIGTGAGNKVTVLGPQNAVGIRFACRNIAGAVSGEGAHHGKKAHAIVTAQAESVLSREERIVA